MRNEMTMDELDSLIDTRIANVVKRDLVPAFEKELGRLAKLPGPGGMKDIYGTGEIPESLFGEDKDSPVRADGF